MHIGLTGIFEKAPLRTPEGTLDAARIRSHSRAVLSSLPKFRKRIVRVPLLHHPVLVDDDHFDPDFHLRFVSLEHESMDELKDLVGRIYSEPLDRRRPLWEVWVIDGLPGNKFAVVSKAHHCMVDGVSGIAAFTAMLSASPETTFDPRARWELEPPPAPRELLKRDLQRILGAARALFRRAGPSLRERVRAFAAGMSHTVKAMLPPVSRTSLNPPHVGTTRSFDWAEFDLAAVKAVKNAASAKVNDVVLSTVAGAMRTFLRRRGDDVDDIRFRALVPVSTHERGSDALENEVSALLLPLPIGEPDARRRLSLVSRWMSTEKSSGEVQALSIIQKLADIGSFGIMTAMARAAAHLRLYNVIVTNIRGPDFPLYFLGAPLCGAYPLVPLFGDNAVGIALLSCGGKLFWGFNADRDRVPDLAQLVGHVRDAFHELEEAMTT